MDLTITPDRNTFPRVDEPLRHDPRFRRVFRLVTHYTMRSSGRSAVRVTGFARSGEPGQGEVELFQPRSAGAVFCVVMLLFSSLAFLNEILTLSNVSSNASYQMESANTHMRGEAVPAIVTTGALPSSSPLLAATTTTLVDATANADGPNGVEGKRSSSSKPSAAAEAETPAGVAAVLDAAHQLSIGKLAEAGLGLAKGGLVGSDTTNSGSLGADASVGTSASVGVDKGGDAGTSTLEMLFWLWMASTVLMAAKNACTRRRLSDMWSHAPPSGGSPSPGLSAPMAAQLTALMRPNGAATAIPNPDHLRMALALTGGDFRPEDYDLLRELDRGNPHHSDPSGFHRGLEEGTILRFPVREVSEQEAEAAAEAEAEAATAAAPTTRSSAIANSASCEEGDINRSYSSSSSGATTSNSNPHLQCAVCLAPYEKGDQVRTILCMHAFHVECIDPWLREHSTCPICKMHCE